MVTLGIHKNSSKKSAILIIVAIVVILSRLPFLWVDYGIDPDSYRVIIAAEKMIEKGEYYASRFPGYPVHELCVALMLKGGPFASNIASAFSSTVASILLILIAGYLGVRENILVGLTFAFTPVIYINSTATMDYIWAIAFILGSFYFIIKQKPVLAGILLGISIGCRITSGAMILPFSIYWALHSRNLNNDRKNISVFIATSLLTGALFYIPVINQYGFNFLKFVNKYPPLITVIYKASVGVWGVIGSLALLLWIVYLSFRWHRTKKLINNISISKNVIVCIVVILIYIIAYIRLPHEAGYLIPLVPFVLILISLITPSHVLRIVFLLIIISSFFFYVGKTGTSIKGPIIEDHCSRLYEAEYAEDVIKAVGMLQEKSVIVAGWRLPRIESIIGHDNLDKYGKLVYLIKDNDEYLEYLKNGYSIYFLKGMDEYNAKIYGIDLKAKGAQLLRIDHIDALNR